MYRNQKRMVRVLGELRELSNHKDNIYITKASRYYLARRLNTTPTGIYNAIVNLEKSGMIRIYRKISAANIISFKDTM